ncbi:MAG: hypothetical protein WCD76_03530, partial [Pyrinomonadaceae bacterium]
MSTTHTTREREAAPQDEATPHGAASTDVEPLGGGDASAVEVIFNISAGTDDKTDVKSAIAEAFAACGVEARLSP